MYSTCLFCNGALGRNEAIEHFPVGRRLAFDAAKGRLWVVCPECERWNLTPLETRWEAIEEAERAYRGMKLRVSTDNIGLTRLREGLELVRVGAPLLPEFAAWRYGDQFGRRHRKRMTVVGVGVIAAAAAVPFLPWALGIGSVLSTMSLANGVWSASSAVRSMRDAKRICASVRDSDGALIPLTTKNMRCAAIVRPTKDPERWYLALPHGPMLSANERFKAMRRLGSTRAFERHTELTGAAAVSALGTMLPHINEHGARNAHVRDAVDAVNASADIDQLVRERGGETVSVARPSLIKDGQSYLSVLRPHVRLALEIMTHENDERRAMEGELRQLELRWRDAEEIAGIADSLTLPADVDERLAALRDR